MGSAVGFVVVIMFLAAAFREAKQRRDQKLTRQALRGATAIDAAATEGGIVRVTGRVRIGTHCFDAPLSNRKCAAYRIRIYGLSGGFSNDRELRYEEMQVVPFEIERPDGTRVAIDSKHARLDMPHLPLPPGSEARCSELLTARRLSYKLKKVDFEETVVTDEMRLSVAGLLMKDSALDPDAAERGFRDGQAPAMRIAGNAQHPIIIGVPYD
jgi:hypothetical protein